MLVDFVLRATGENLFFAPICDGSKCFAANEFLECRFLRPLTGDEIRSIVADVFPKRRIRVPRSCLQSVDDSGKLLFKV